MWMSISLCTKLLDRQLEMYFKFFDTVLYLQNILANTCETNLNSKSEKATSVHLIINTFLSQLNTVAVKKFPYHTLLLPYLAVL